MKNSPFYRMILACTQKPQAMVVALTTILLLLSQPAAAQLSSATSIDIGLSQLRDANPELTEGVGVKAHLVEAFIGDGYAPNEFDSSVSDNSLNIIGFPTSGTRSEIYSGHALTSARHFFGSNGVARDLGTSGLSIDCYAASGKEEPNDNTPNEDWVNSLVFNGGQDPVLSEFDRSTVTSHSYIFITDDAGQLPSLMQRLDHIINESDMTTVVGTSNGGRLPPGWAPAYNVIAVGLSSGAHGNGLTTTYGSGRVGIDVVAPEPFTSSGTPVVAGAVAILQDAADGSDASTSEVIRATIMAGATKGDDDIAGSWTRTNTQPLDSVFGAGELNVLNSYNIQQGGEFDGGEITPVVLSGFKGWDYESNLELNGQRLYEFEVTAGTQLEDLSVVLAWNQNIVDTGLTQFLFSPQEELANLSLELLDDTGEVVDFSFSAVDNVEHVFQEILPEGTYQLRVSNDDGFESDYGLAWRGTEVAIVEPAEPVLLGDCNLDGEVNFMDISPFIAILSAGDFQVEADTNGDGFVSFLDIGPFISILSSE